MAKRRWTVVLVPHGSEPSKILEVSGHAIRLGGVLVLALVFGSLLVGYAAFGRSVDLSRSARLSAENVALTRDLSDLNRRLGHLSDTMEVIARRDSLIRLLANLDPLSADVQAAGIGGPAPAEPPQPATGSERKALQLRTDLNGLIRRANLLASSFDEAADSLEIHNRRLAATPSIMPTQGWLSSAFSMSRMHPLLHTARPHEGIDVSAPMGTPIEAPAAGVVKQTGWVTGYGYTVTLDHGYGITTRFAHTSKILVRVGQRVQRGDRIALVGNTGLSTGPHLHYEVRVNGKPVNPLRYVLPEVSTE
ncbi:MAG TPA: M23 family metallopeptidase [Gemmatimonadales bacterium]|nr:M23 family metallopeptidase [Gemmatimonadales bacterium]